MHQSLSLRSQLALAMISAAGAAIADSPKRAEEIAKGIQRALDVLSPTLGDTARSPCSTPTSPAAGCACASGSCAHDSSCAVHNEPALPAGPCDCSLEAEIQAKGKTAPRITPNDIQREIVGEHYFTAEQGARHPDAQNPLDFGDIPGNLGLLTFCVLRLHNGFTVTGESACASPENFDAAIGRRIARENAVQKMWSLLGFRLRDRLAGIDPS